MLLLLLLAKISKMYLFIFGEGHGEGTQPDVLAPLPTRVPISHGVAVRERGLSISPPHLHHT